MVLKRKRKEETFYDKAFSIGKEYTRNKIAELGLVQPLENSREWTGIVEFRNCILLFSTLEKEGLSPEHNYADLFDEGYFHWESQNRNTQESPIIQRIVGQECPIILFCRLRPKEKGRALPFTFVGEIHAVDFEDERPVKMSFLVDSCNETSTKTLREIYEWRPKGDRVLGVLEQPDREPRVVRGQGRQANPKKRKAVEMRAMESAVKHYANLGYDVVDTSANNPFDLLCERQGRVLRVEVKGTTGKLGAVEVTIGEVRSSRQEGIETDLFVLYSIELKESPNGEFEGIGGQIWIEQDWKANAERLEATQFKYLLPLHT